MLRSSCKRDNPIVDSNETIITSCTTEHPFEGILWLKEIRDGFAMQANPLPKRITQYSYKNECVFLIDGCVGCDDNLSYVYNENQDLICEFGGVAGINTCPSFEIIATEKLILYGN